MIVTKAIRRLRKSAKASIDAVSKRCTMTTRALIYRIMRAPDDEATKNWIWEQISKTFPNDVKQTKKEFISEYNKTTKYIIITRKLLNETEEIIAFGAVTYIKEMKNGKAVKNGKKSDYDFEDNTGENITVLFKELGLQNIKREDACEYDDLIVHKDYRGNRLSIPFHILLPMAAKYYFRVAKSFAITTSASKDAVLKYKKESFDNHKQIKNLNTKIAKHYTDKIYQNGIAYVMDNNEHIELSKKWYNLADNVFILPGKCGPTTDITFQCSEEIISMIGETQK